MKRKYTKAARVVLTHSIQMANIVLQALICIAMTGYTSALRCEGYDRFNPLKNK